MMEIAFQRQAEFWGQAFEVLVKRGVLGALCDRKLVDCNVASLQPWRKTRVAQVSGALIRNLGVVDETVIEQVRLAVEHLSVVAYGLGHTAMREYLRKLDRPLSLGQLSVRALWCPLQLPGPREDVSAQKQALLAQLHACLDIAGPADPALSDKGMPANADFFVWLSGPWRDDHLLVQEYSYDMPPALGNFSTESAHLDELLRHRRLVDSRSVFARVAAEVEAEHFELSEDIRTHLMALTSDNKPLLKLCQAASYAESLVGLLQRTGKLTKPCVARALAITSNGLESLAARFGPQDVAQESRVSLMRQMGAAYRGARKPIDDDPAALTLLVQEAFNGVLRRLPAALQAGFRPLRQMPQAGQDYHFDFEETLASFANPMQLYSRQAALDMVDDAEALRNYFGQPARQAIAQALDDLVGASEAITLRDIHAAGVVAGLQAARPGRLNLLALEGNPGIGKTTALTTYLGRQQSGFLFLYVSPRVVINRDVTEVMARRDGAPSGVLTVTTNAQLIASAERWHKDQVGKGLDRVRNIDGAVVADGVADLVRPRGSILVLTPDQERDIEMAHAGGRFRKTTLSENEDIIQERTLLGVLSAMSQATRELLEINPAVNRAVLTAALQGFRDKGSGKTTIAALSGLFKSSANRKAGVEERRAFAKRMPTIVIMVDELAGDGAGAPFVHAVALGPSRSFSTPSKARFRHLRWCWSRRTPRLATRWCSIAT